MLELHQFTKKYKDKLIFQEADFQAQSGEIVLLTSKSGKGKTTLLDIIAGLKTWEKGDYFYKGQAYLLEDDEAMSAFRGQSIAYIPQDFALIADYTVRENIALPFLYSSKPYQAEAEIDRLLRTFNLEEVGDSKVRKISGGQKQRAAIIRGLVVDSPILLADEPTANLDEENIQLVQELLLEQKEKGKIVIIASHDSRLQSIADRIYRIKNQKLIIETK